MNDVTISTRAGEDLPSLVARAANTLASARTDAEVLEGFRIANTAYRGAQVAKSSVTIGRAKRAHDGIIAVAHRVQADTLQIMADAQARIADAYDQAQNEGEIRGNGERRFSSPEKVSVAELGLTPKFIHEARQVRDAEQTDPGIIKRTVEAALERGEEPTKTLVKEAVSRRPPSVVSTKGRELDRIMRAWNGTSHDVKLMFLQKISKEVRAKFGEVFGHANG